MSAAPGRAGEGHAPLVRRILLLVGDSFGVGEQHDTAAYGHAGVDTIGNTARAVDGLRVPNLERMGLGALTDVAGVAPVAGAGTAHGSLAERSAGNDTTTGHWELAGIVLEEPFPTYPQGFPGEVILPFEAAIGRPVLGNVAASGTEIVDRLGEEHVATGRPIVYTSADSVFQIACHKSVVPLETLYEWCALARTILDGRHRVGRVIARPFEGEPGRFARTHERRDFSVPPPGPTLLDALVERGVLVYGVGKIPDIFAGRGLTSAEHTSSNDHGIDLSLEYLRKPAVPSLVFTNLVDFDTKYGHRNDPAGYAACLEAFDARLPELLGAVGDDGLLFVTGDHGCDPTDESTDHTRERVPVLVGGLPSGEPIDLGTRASFADAGATIGELLGLDWGSTGLAGVSFADRLGFGPAAPPAP